MVFLVAALFLLGIVSGAAAHIPPALTAVIAAVICGWLLVFTLRERRAESGSESGCGARTEARAGSRSGPGRESR